MYNAIQLKILNNTLIIQLLTMQAVGNEVIIAILPLILALIAILYIMREHIKQLYFKIFGNPNQQRRELLVEQHPRYGGGQCTICLETPKKYQISMTCGHSFCAMCLLALYNRDRQKINCPLCRKQATSIFKSFNNDQGDDEQRANIIQTINQYNNRFDDNRPWIRRISELPYVLRRVRHLFLNPLFIMMYIRSFHFFRAIFVSIIYLVLPYDILPERFVGILGLLDDFFVFFYVIILSATLFSLVHLRNRGVA